MKPNDRTIVHSRPQARTVASDSIMYRETALLVSPLAAELPDSITTRRTPACLASTTLYRLFASKDDLIGAYIERADRLYREWFDAAAAAGGRDPREQILAVF